uniref:TATA-box binding protein n=1 Tax=Trichomonas gallinae TaxID=56777 RepID=A0AA96S3B3_9EUKA|nr:TATA-box binding protein [Trichomonas gallinae]
MEASSFFDKDGSFKEINLDDAESVKWYSQLEENGNEVVSSIDGIESMKPKVVNVIGVAQYDQSDFDLISIAQAVRNAEYKPKRMKAVIVRIREPKATGLIFTNGKINIVGCKSIEDSKRAAKKFGKLLVQILGTNVKLIDFKISSIVAVVNAQFNIQIGAIAVADGHSKFCDYRPDRFAGLVYRLVQPKVTMLIFQSGSIILNAKSVDDLDYASEWVYPILQNFKKQTTEQIRQAEDSKYNS